MARLSYDFPIGYDRPVDYDQPVAPDVQTLHVETTWPADSVSETTLSADPSQALATGSDEIAELGTSDTATNLASGNETTLEVEVAE